MRTRLLPVAALFLMSALTASAQQTVPDSLAFDINAVIKRLAVEMDKEFIVDPRLVGASGRSSTTGDDADYETLLGVLRSYGHAAFEVGDQIRIVPEQAARAEPSMVLNEDDSRVSDHAIVTRVLDVADLDVTLPDGDTTSSAAQLVPVLRPMMSTNVGNVTTIPGTTKLIIVDRYDNVRRITAIVDELRQ